MGPFGTAGVPVGAPLSGLTMFQHQIKAVHESAHMEDNQRQEAGEVERRPRFITRSPTVLDREGKKLMNSQWAVDHFLCVCFFFSFILYFPALSVLFLFLFPLPRSVL